MSACSTDVIRVSEQLNPFAGSARFDPKTTASLSRSSSGPLSPSAEIGTSEIQPVTSGGIASAPLDVPSSANGSAPVKPKTLTAAQPKLAALPTATATQKQSAVESGRWGTEGGSEIIVGKDETLKILSDRYGVPEDALRSANKLKPGMAPKAGTKFIIPVFNAGSGEPVKAKDARTKTASLQGTEPSPTSAPAAPIVTAPKSVNGKAAQSAPVNADSKTQTATLETSVAPSMSEQNSGPEAVKAVEGPGFRWPARGRIIAPFGDKNGVKNAGINISLPEGTPIKAAESGTVAYAGNEVKGFGNLVMVRHSDGWVSVYANTSEIKVKRGDTIKRGQVIALSGQSGDVSAPQLHFELRKGSVPVDPVEHLSGD